MRRSVLKTAVVGGLLTVGTLAPASPAAAEILTARVCPDGSYGVVIGVNSPQTGQREVVLCVRQGAWTY